MWRQVGMVLGVFIGLGWVSAARAESAPAASPGGVAPGVAADTAPTPPPPAASECFPHCRSGYVCHQAQCVSLCNPPCGDGQSCTTAGECLQPAPPPPPPPPLPAAAPLPVASLPPPIPEGVAPAGSPNEPSALREPGRFVFVAHLGLEMFGAGEAEDKTCENSACQPTRSADFKDKSPVVLGADGLFHVTRGLRLGLGYWLVPYSAIGAEPNKAKSLHIGSEHALNLVVEGIAPLRPNLAVALRAQGGPRLLVTGGELADSQDSFLSACSRMPVDHCEADKGPFFGGQFATTVGLVFGDRVRARVDLSVERYFLKVSERRVTDASLDLSGKSTNFGTRFYVLAGLEL